MAYSGSYTITVPADTGMAGDLTDFSFPFSITDANLKSVANGGVVTENAGSGIPDCAFFSDAGLTTPVKYGRISWSASAGTLAGVVKLPTHSKTTAQTIYLAAGNASIVADPQDKANSHDATFTRVWYPGGDGTTLNLVEWKAGVSLTNNNSVTAGSGPFTGIGGAVFASASSKYLDVGSASPTAMPVTMEIVFNPSVINATQTVFSACLAGTSGSFVLQARATGVLRCVATGASAPDTLANAIVQSAWNYGAGIIASATSRTVHVNAGADVTSSVSATPSTPDTTVLGAVRAGTIPASQFFDGSIACARESSQSRSRDWRLATKKSFESGFYSAGSFTSSATPFRVYYRR